MRGIFSAAPGQSAIRLMVGTHLLLLVQACLVLWSGDLADVGLRIIVGGTAILGLSGFIAALHGGNTEDGHVWRPRQRLSPGVRS